MRTVPLVLAVLAVPAVAHADDTTVDVHVDVEVHTNINPAPEPDSNAPWLLRGSHWEAELAIEGAPIGGIHVADVSGGRIGVLAIVGRQLLERMRLGVEVGVARFAAQRDLYTADGWWDGWQELGGETQRIGASLRYRLVTRTSFLAPLATGDVSFYSELGVGREHVAFDGGGELTRADVMFGAGFEAVGGGDRFGGIDLGVRVQLAKKPDHGVPACEAACRIAPDDATHDFSILLHLGAMFGG